MARKNQYLSVKELKSLIQGIFEDQSFDIPIKVLDDLENKLMDRAAKIAAVKKESATDKTYLTRKKYEAIMAEIKRGPHGLSRKKKITKKKKEEKRRKKLK